MLSFILKAVSEDIFCCREERSGLRDEEQQEKRPERGSKGADKKLKRGKFKQQALSTFAFS